MDLTRRVLETCIDLLGFSAPEKCNANARPLGNQ